MGGLAGHMSHLYDNPRLTFSEIKSVLKKASEGKLEGTEKTDGQNLYISFSVPKQELRAARNKTNIKAGGMSARQLANKFAFSDELKKSFSQAFRDFENVIKQFPKEKQIEIFGPDTDIYYNAEIINPETANVINYDTKLVSVHRGGGAEFDKETGSPKTVSIEDPETGEMITGPKDISKNAELLASELEKVQQDLAGNRFKIQMDAIQNLKKLEDETVLNQAMDRLESEISSEGISDNQMVIEYVMARLLTLLREEDLELDDETEKLILKRILLSNPTFRSAYGYDKMPAEVNKRALKKAGESGDKNKIIYIMNNSDDFLKKAIAPIESIIHDFSVEMLKNLESIFILDNKKETERLRGELEKAIKAIESSGSESAMDILSKQMEKIKSVENVSTAAEGFVFDHDGHTYKFTGNFAPVNQILGLFKYGRGDIPALEKITEGKENMKKVVIYPGRFQPMGRHHYEVFKALVNDFEDTDVYVATSNKVDPPRSPLNFEEKKKIMMTHGIPEANILQMKSPYNARELVDILDLDNTILIYAVGEKDMKDSPRFANLDGVTKKGKPTYLKSHAASNDKFKPATEHAYIMVAPHVSTKLPSGEEMSGTTIRKAMANLNKENFEEIMGWYDEEIFNMLKKKMSPEEVEKQDDISVAIMEMVEEMYLETIRKVGKDKWAVYPKKGGKRLGTHSSEKAAKKQLAAIEISKQQNESEEKIDEISSMAGGSVAGYSSPFPGIRIRMKQKEKKDTNYTKNNKRFPYEQ